MILLLVIMVPVALMFLMPAIAVIAGLASGLSERRRLERLMRESMRG